MNDVLMSKAASIERCVVQVNRYDLLPSKVPFGEDFLRQDAICLNIQRTCQLAIDMSNHIIKVRGLGLPNTSRESFSCLAREGVISADLAAKMLTLVDFCNVLVHRDEDLDLAVLRSVIDYGVADIVAFAQVCLAVE